MQERQKQREIEKQDREQRQQGLDLQKRVGEAQLKQLEEQARINATPIEKLVPVERLHPNARGKTVAEVQRIFGNIEAAVIDPQAQARQQIIDAQKLAEITRRGVKVPGATAQAAFPGASLPTQEVGAKGQETFSSDIDIQPPPGAAPRYLINAQGQVVGQLPPGADVTVLPQAPDRKVVINSQGQVVAVLPPGVQVVTPPPPPPLSRQIIDPRTGRTVRELPPGSPAPTVLPEPNKGGTGAGEKLSPASRDVIWQRSLTEAVFRELGKRSGGMKIGVGQDGSPTIEMGAGQPPLTPDEITRINTTAEEIYNARIRRTQGLPPLPRPTVPPPKPVPRTRGEVERRTVAGGGATQEIPPTSPKTITRGELDAIAKRHGISFNEAARRARSQGYRVVP